MKLVEYHKHFLTNTVNLSQRRIDQLDGRVEAITNFLQGENGFGEAAEDLIAQGSYAQKTIINPVSAHEFDADVLLLMPEQDGWEPKDYVANLYTTFRGSSTYKEMVGRRSRCVVVDYANEFHIDVVPYLVRDDGHWITNRATNEMENTNPEGFNAWLDDRDRIANRRLVDVIRLMKYLRDYKQTFSIRSVTLSYLLAEQVSDFDNLTGRFSDLPTAFVHLLNKLDQWLQLRPTLPVLTDPSCPAQNFHDRWDNDEYVNFRTKIHDYAQKAQEALDKDTSEGVEATVKAWQVLFGPGFVKPPVKKVALAESPRTFDDPEEQITDRVSSVDLSDGYKVKIRGRVRKSGRQGAYKLADRGNRVQKNRTIDFDLVICDVPKPFTVYWKVKNYGEEAEDKNCLRGQVVEGLEKRHEPTAYRGNHYVEVYIVKDGVCVATNRQRVTVL